MSIHDNINVYNEYQIEIKRKQLEIRLLKVERDKYLNEVALFLTNEGIDGFEHKRCNQLFLFGLNKKGEKKLLVKNIKKKQQRKRF